MLIWVGRGVTTLMVVVLTLVHPKVAGFEVKINESVLTNELSPTRSEQNDYAAHIHKMPTKPSKFDMDMDDMTLTDDRLLYEKETKKREASAKSDHLRCRKSFSSACIKENFADLLEAVTNVETYNVTDSIQIVKNPNRTTDVAMVPNNLSLIDRVKRFAKNYALKIKIPTDLFSPRTARTFFGAIFQGKSTFLTGFGLGFLAFGLKKLLLPLVVGVQIIKSLLLALFLPSILGSIGKIVGKGVSTFAQSSQSAGSQPEENFEFKDQEYFNDDYMTHQPTGTLPASAMYDETMLQKTPEIASRFSYAAERIPHMNTVSDRYYTRFGGHGKKQDYKNFHGIPSSVLMLSNYDPFYSPLLSRLDAVFARLRYTTEGCREYGVCAMYKHPALFAPYSNLVSAQLSKELNDLQKPSPDNPDVLRFFRYMKAAKDGQDQHSCEDLYRGCAMVSEDQSLRQNQAMLATYEDITKLVQARNL